MGASLGDAGSWEFVDSLRVVTYAAVLGCSEHFGRNTPVGKEHGLVRCVIAHAETGSVGPDLVIAVLCRYENVKQHMYSPRVVRVTRGSRVTRGPSLQVTGLLL
jgi:hypothetical protein